MIHGARGAAHVVAVEAAAALAHYQRAMLHHENDEADQARAALRAAKQHEYRLNERLRFDMNRLRLFYDKDVERQAALLTQWTTRYPKDPSDWRAVRDFQGTQEHLDGAIAAAQRVGPSIPWTPITWATWARCTSARGSSQRRWPQQSLRLRSDVQLEHPLDVLAAAHDNRLVASRQESHIQWVVVLRVWEGRAEHGPAIADPAGECLVKGRPE